MGKVLCRCLFVVLCLVFVVSCSGDPEHVHTPDEGTVTTAATCTTEGVMTYTCTSCKQVVKTEPISALGHNMQEGKR